MHEIKMEKFEETSLFSSNPLYKKLFQAEGQFDRLKFSNQEENGKTCRTGESFLNKYQISGLTFSLLG